VATLGAVRGVAALVGRRSELAVLRGVLQGGSGVVLVTGEAGIGKTRLMTAALGQARSGGVVTMAAGCLPLSEKLPLLPLVDVLRDLHRLGGGQVLGTVLAGLPAYVRTELARLLPSVADCVPAGDQGARERLFTAVGELFLAVARRGPVVLLFEDVHWADAATLDLLTYLSAAARESAPTLAVTCRTDEAPLAARAGEWLSHARRAGALELRLGPLSRGEVAELVGGDAPAAFVDELYARAEGNPFLTEQLIAAAQDLRLPRQIPGGLAEVLLGRTRRLAPEARSVLAALAVAGRPLSEQTLAPVAGLDGSSVRDALRVLTDAALLAPGTGQTDCGLRHALLAEAVLADLLPGERAGLHARVAEALEATGDAAFSAEVAGHWAAAGRPADALRGTVTAAEVAERVFAFADAADLWQRAVAMAEGHPGAATALGLDLARLHLAAIDALVASGRGAEATTLAERARARFADWPDRPVAAIIGSHAALFRTAENLDEVVPLLDEALRGFADAPPSAEQAKVELLYALTLRVQGHAGPAFTHAEEALRLAEAAGAGAQAAKATALLANVYFIQGRVEEGWAALDRARMLADALDDPRPALWTAFYTSDACFHLGRTDEARRVALDALDRARRSGRENTFVAALLEYYAVLTTLELGATEDAAGVLRPATPDAPRKLDWPAHAARVTCELQQGALEDAARRFEAVRAFAGGHLLDWVRELVPRGAEVLLWRRSPEQALEEVEQTLVRCAGTELEPFCGQLLVLGLRAAADLAGRGRARRQPAPAPGADVRRLGATLDGMAGRPFADHPFVTRIRADRAGWAAEGTRAAGRSDPLAWEEVAGEWEKLERPHRAAYAWWRCAEAQLAHGGRPGDAARSLQAAAESAAGMAPLVGAVHRLARRARIPLDPPVPDPAPVEPFDLTARERLVVRLVAEGRTNAQIGTELFMSPKTASVHVSNILRKLGAANRAEAARKAQRAGLFDDGGCRGRGGAPPGGGGAPAPPPRGAGPPPRRVSRRRADGVGGHPPVPAEGVHLGRGGERGAQVGGRPETVDGDLAPRADDVRPGTGQHPARRAGRDGALGLRGVQDAGGRGTDPAGQRVGADRVGGHAPVAAEGVLLVRGDHGRGEGGAGHEAVEDDLARSAVDLRAETGQPLVPRAGRGGGLGIGGVRGAGGRDADQTGQRVGADRVGDHAPVAGEAVRLVRGDRDRGQCGVGGDVVEDDLAERAHDLRAGADQPLVRRAVRGDDLGLRGVRDARRRDADQAGDRRGRGRDGGQQGCDEAEDQCDAEVGQCSRPLSGTAGRAEGADGHADLLRARGPSSTALSTRRWG
jgi:DNA-binding CsgD family transcriptional regulator/tetratricopeptide (TPR) repeat protein